MKQFEEVIKKLHAGKVGEDYAFKMGYDCGINGSNSINSHFTIFSSTTNLKAWEEGKKSAEDKLRKLRSH